jgi:hypothetical protein
MDYLRGPLIEILFTYPPTHQPRFDQASMPHHRSDDDRYDGDTDDDRYDHRSPTPPPQGGELTDLIEQKIYDDDAFKVGSIRSKDELLEFLRGVVFPPDFQELMQELIASINFRAAIDFTTVDTIEQFITKISELVSGRQFGPDEIQTPEDVYRICIPVVADMFRNAKVLFDTGIADRAKLLEFNTRISEALEQQNGGWLDNARTIRVDFGTASKIDNVLFGVSDRASHWHVPYATHPVIEYGMFVCRLR